MSEKKTAKAEVAKPADVNVRVTKFGEGKVSTGEHVPARGDVMARNGQLLPVTAAVAGELEARGLAEIQ